MCMLMYCSDNRKLRVVIWPGAGKVKPFESGNC